MIAPAVKSLPVKELVVFLPYGRIKSYDKHRRLLNKAVGENELLSIMMLAALNKTISSCTIEQSIQAASHGTHIEDIVLEDPYTIPGDWLWMRGVVEYFEHFLSRIDFQFKVINTIHARRSGEIHIEVFIYGT